MQKEMNERMLQEEKEIKSKVNSLSYRWKEKKKKRRNEKNKGIHEIH